MIWKTIKSTWQDYERSVPEKLDWLGEKLKAWAHNTRRKRQQSKSNLISQLQHLNESDLEEVLEEILNVNIALNMEVDKEEIY